MWIPGHSGIIGNDIVDEHALISINNYNETVLINQMPYDDLKKLINKYTKNKWQRICINKNTKLNPIKIDICCWINPKLNHKEDTVFNRFCIGHTKITYGFPMGQR